MRFKLGILAPFFLQIGISFLYSTITYDIVELSLFSTLTLYVFPILIIYILSPQVITVFTQFSTRVSDAINHEIKQLILHEEYDMEPGRSQLQTRFFPKIDDTVSQSIQTKLTPLLTKRAFNYYIDNYHSRNNSMKQEKSLEYYEAMVLFSGLSLIFFLIDLILIWIISITSVNFYFITLDYIENKSITLTISVVLILVILASWQLLQYASDKMLYYLPYAIPMLFNEKPENKFLRREMIRSLVDYNYDNTIPHSKQKTLSHKLNKLLFERIEPLLNEDILISARTEFAYKLAWREYSKLMIKEDETSDLLVSLAMGKKVGPLIIDEKDLLGLYSDIQYINYSKEKWNELNTDNKIFVYFQLHRVMEFLFSKIAIIMKIYTNEDDFNLFEFINKMYSDSIITEKDKDELHSFRILRNTLAHEMGTTIEVSYASLYSTYNAIIKILKTIEAEF